MAGRLTAGSKAAIAAVHRVYVAGIHHNHYTAANTPPTPLPHAFQVATDDTTLVVAAGIGGDTGPLNSKPTAADTAAASSPAATTTLRSTCARPNSWTIADRYSWAALYPCSRAGHLSVGPARAARCGSCQWPWTRRRRGRLHGFVWASWLSIEDGRDARCVEGLYEGPCPEARGLALQSVAVGEFLAAHEALTECIVVMTPFSLVRIR